MMNHDSEKEVSGAMADSVSIIVEKDGPSLSSVAEVMAGLATAVQGADAAPTQGEKDVYKEYKQRLDKLLARWKEIANSVTK